MPSSGALISPPKTRLSYDADIRVLPFRPAIVKGLSPMSGAYALTRMAGTFKSSKLLPRTSLTFCGSMVLTVSWTSRLLTYVVPLRKRLKPSSRCWLCFARRTVSRTMNFR